MQRRRPGFDSADPAVRGDLRDRLARALIARHDAIGSDAAAILPFSGEALDPAYCARIASLLVHLLAFAVRAGKVDARAGLVVDLHETATERGLGADRLFGFVYLIERAALDELAFDDGLGATTEPWPIVAQLVRRASFDLLAAWTERGRLEPSQTAITDRLTSLYSRAVFDAVLANELERAGRFGGPLSLIVFDVDHLARINHEHGHGVGDKILERIGITLKNYFRQSDWAARLADDAMAVLLTRTDADTAVGLAEKARATVEERLELTDHRDDSTLRVTVSGAAINLQIAAGEVIDRERLMADAEAAVKRAKERGRNRIERIDQPYSSS